MCRLMSTTALDRNMAIDAQDCAWFQIDGVPLWS